MRKSNLSVVLIAGILCASCYSLRAGDVDLTESMPGNYAAIAECTYLKLQAQKMAVDASLTPLPSQHTSEIQQTLGQGYEVWRAKFVGAGDRQTVVQINGRSTIYGPNFYAEKVMPLARQCSAEAGR